MRRVLGWITFGLLGLVALTVVLYLTVIHVNDSRMSFPDASGSTPITAFVERKASLLGDRMPHRLSLSGDEYKARRAALLKALPDYALPESVRFVSPFQIYVPAGAYPLKLDAQDGLFIPNDQTLTVEPGLSGAYEARFATLAPKSGGTLVIASAGAGVRPLATVEMRAPPLLFTGMDLEGRWYNDYIRFLKPDPVNRLESWTEQRLPLELAAGATLTFTCKNAVHGCLLGDIGFYQAAPKAPRSVLVMLVDTMRADALHGGNAPRMAAFADQSVEFTDALAAGNMTSPSTNAFLSCRRASQLGALAFAYNVSREYREDYYKSRMPSFPARMWKDGYDTTMIGNVSVISEIYGVGVNHGFARQVAIETDGYDTPAVARDAIQWLRTHGDEKFLLYVHFSGAHAPYRAPLKDVASSYPGLHAFHSYADSLLWLYQSKVAYSDRYVGKVLDEMGRLGLDKTTTVVLTADHGDQLEKRRYTGNTAADDFEGAYFDHGATLYNDEIHVPLVVHRPGEPARHVDDYVSTLDLGPTLLDLTDTGIPAYCAGESLAPYLAGQHPAGLKERVLGSEGFHGRMIVLDGRWKYIRSYEPTDKRIYDFAGWGAGVPTQWLAPEQLFDLAVDPDERHDVQTERPDILARARTTYKSVYEVKDGYELVIEAPDPQPFTALFPPGTKVHFEIGDGPVTETPAGVGVTGSGRQRYLLELSFAAEAAAAPVVSIGGEDIKLTATSMRLPLTVPKEMLPVETGGRYTLLEPALTRVAYLRKVEDDGQKNRRLLTGNPAFEKVLREWGYLNDK